MNIKSQPCGADVDGAALRVAERSKRATYPELAAAGPQRLIVLGAEVVEHSVWCAIWFGSAHFKPHPPSGAPPSVAGHAGGGACGRAAGRSWHGPRLCPADGLVDLRARRSTAGTRARVSGRGCRQQAAIPGVVSHANGTAQDRVV